MDPLPECEIIKEDAGNEENERVVDRLRRNDPALKELTIHAGGIGMWWTEMILQAFDAIATNSSLKILNIEGNIGVLLYFIDDIKKDRVRRALSLNTSLKDIRTNDFNWSTSLLDIVMASPNLEFLTIRYYDCHSHSIEDVTAMVQVLCGHINLHSLTFEGLWMNSDRAAAFATAFQGNQAIKTLIMRRSFEKVTSAVSLVEALPHDHALEVLVFDDDFDDMSVDENCLDDAFVRIVSTLCRTPLKVLSLADSTGFKEISQEGCTRIIQTLRENEHSLTKLELFRDSQDSMWHNFIRIEIENLTWENHFQVEKETWLDQFLGHHSPTKELLFGALERAKKVDKEQFSKAPNILFYLIKEAPDFIVQAIRDGL